jgi:hypothetical protein
MSPAPFERKGNALDVSPLVRSLRSATNSYKHLLFRTVLKEAPREKSGFIAYHRIFAGMLAEAWWPAVHYRLSLGKQDMVVALLERSIDAIDDLRVRPDDVPALVAAIPFDLRRERTTGLLRYVPQRLIAPWFGDEVRGREDVLIPTLSVERFSSLKPLYKLLDDGLQLHPEWNDFIVEWHDVFCGWSDANWLAFLEARNPHAPGLFSKIKPAFERGSLTAQRRIWTEACTQEPFHCIYTGTVIDPGFFALDHFLPHAFTGHDRFWNLTPMAPTLNIAKSDAIPAEQFVEKLAAQHAALHRIAPKLSEGARRELRRSVDGYCTDLGVSDDDLTVPDRLSNAYLESFSLLRGIAARMGFPLDWQPRNG